MGDKAYRRGGHRVIAPGTTVARLGPHLGELGITRISDVTGLDRIGIPVVMVVRPAARSLVVAQGKGLDPAAAMASGLMESIEAWHGERAPWQRVATQAELAAGEAVIDVGRLPARRESRFHDRLPIPWILGVDLLAGDRPIWVPHALVHTDYRLPPPPGAGCFCTSSNGLASGNRQDEALVHGLCEVIERDALAIWHRRPVAERMASRIDPATIDDPDGQALLARFEAADIGVAVYDATSDVGIATFHVEIVERHERHPPFFPPPISGDGCHPARAIALARALTEAAQSRLTYITGARDDIDHAVYQPDAEHVARARRRILGPSWPGRAFQSVPTFDAPSFADDIGRLLARLRAVGITEVAVVDLSRPGPGEVAVVRVVVPGLETVIDHPSALPGPRALTAGPRALAAGPRLRPLAEAMM